MDLLLDNARLVTMDPNLPLEVHGHLRTHGDLITDVGEGVAQGIEPHERRLDMAGDLVLPGFVNTHHHLSSTLMRGVRPPAAHTVDRGPDPRLVRAILAQGTAETRAGVLLAYSQLIRSGVTTTTDSQGAWRGTQRADGALEAAHASGLRVVFSPAFTDRTELIPSSHRHDAASAVEELHRLKDRHATDRVRVIPEALSLPRASDDLIRALHSAGNEDFAMHMAFSSAFDEWARSTHGHPTIIHLDQLGVLDERFLGAHPVHLDDDELRRMAASGARTSYCAVSNMSIGAPTADIDRLLGAGIPVGLGLDHPNDAHDMFETMKMSVLAQRQLKGGPTTWSAERGLSLATSGGARALGIHDRVGSLEAGKQADLVVLDRRHPDLLPPAGAARLVVEAASPATVRHVMAAGDWLMWDRRLSHLDEDEIRDDATAAQERVLATSHLAPPPADS